MTLSAKSSLGAHALQNVVLVTLSLALLPLSTLLLCLSYALRSVSILPHAHQRAVALSHPDFRPRTILVTGVGMTKGLALARLFYQAGHHVIGADFEPGGALVCGRVSRAVSKFYRLDAPTPQSGAVPYLQSLLGVVHKENVDLWVSCSGVASAVEDGQAKELIEARTKCKAIQFDCKTTQMLHEKHSFIARTRELGLTVPETFEVTSRAQVEEVLANAHKGRKYILKPIGMDDSARADLTLLPRRNQQETVDHIARLRINEKNPWIIQQFIEGQEFCTHSLVVDGEVKAFVACPSAELLMHYEALPHTSALSMAMLSFTKNFSQSSGSGFTGHLSFDFLVSLEDCNNQRPEDITLYPIECNPRAHTAVVLFNGTIEMADAYTSVLDVPRSPTAGTPNRSLESTIVTPKRGDKYYWLGHDLVTLLLLPVLDFVLFRISFLEVVQNLDLLADHILTWKDGTYELWDPLPWWWLYHVYWPLRFGSKLVKGEKWSRVNVSTCKVFEC